MLESDVPVLIIQCDWEDFIDVPYKTIWISSKSRLDSSVNFNVRGATLECDNPDYSATLGKNTLCISHLPTGRLVHFIPPAKLLKNNKHKEIISLDVSEGGLGVSSCRNGNLLIWDHKTGEIRKELIGHSGDVYKCLLFPSRVVVLSAGADMRIKIWAADSGVCPMTLCGHTKAVTDVSIIGRGRNIVSVSKDGRALLWNVGEGRIIDTILLTTEQLNCCDIGQLPENIPRVQSEDEKEVATDDKILLVGSETGIAYGIQLSTRTIMFSTKCSSPINSVLYYSSDLFLVGTQDGLVLQCNLEDGCVLKVIHESNSAVLCMTRLPNKGVLIGRYCGSVSYYNPLSDTSDRVELTGPDCEPVYAIAVANEAVYTACRDSKIRKYNVNDLLAAGI